MVILCQAIFNGECEKYKKIGFSFDLQEETRGASLMQSVMTERRSLLEEQTIGWRFKDIRRDSRDEVPKAFRSENGGGVGGDLKREGDEMTSV